MRFKDYMEADAQAPVTGWKKWLPWNWKNKKKDWTPDWKDKQDQMHNQEVGKPFDPETKAINKKLNDLLSMWQYEFPDPVDQEKIDTALRNYNYIKNSPTDLQKFIKIGTQISQISPEVGRKIGNRLQLLLKQWQRIKQEEEQKQQTVRQAELEPISLQNKMERIQKAKEIYKEKSQGKNPQQLEQLILDIAQRMNLKVSTIRAYLKAKDPVNTPILGVVTQKGRRRGIDKFDLQ